MSISAQWSRESLAWCGGLFEGEGCISWGRAPHLTLASTDKDAVDRFFGILGVGYCCGPYRRPGVRKDIWIWQCGTHRYAQAVLAAIWPYLCERRKTRAIEILKRGAAMRPWRRKTKNVARHIHESKNGNRKQAA